MTNPTLITTPFAENGDKNTIPESVGAEPQNATMQAGFPPITQQKISEGGIPPERNDFNGILNLYGQHIVHLNKGLPYEFDQDFANKIGGYPLNARLMLDNGGIVKSTVANNVNNPNNDMTGWVNVGNVGEVESIEEMLAILNPNNGNRVFVRGFQGDDFIFDAGKLNINNGHSIFNGWERSVPYLHVSPLQWGADPTGATESTVAFQAWAAHLSALTLSATYPPVGLIPAGTYTINGQIELKDLSNCTIYSLGALISGTSSSALDALFKVNNAVNSKIFGSLTISCNGLENYGSAFKVTASNGSPLDPNGIVSHCDFFGITAERSKVGYQVGEDLDDWDKHVAELHFVGCESRFVQIACANFGSQTETSFDGSTLAVGYLDVSHTDREYRIFKIKGGIVEYTGGSLINSMIPSSWVNSLALDIQPCQSSVYGNPYPVVSIVNPHIEITSKLLTVKSDITNTDSSFSNINLIGCKGWCGLAPSEDFINIYDASFDGKISIDSSNNFYTTIVGRTGKNIVSASNSVIFDVNPLAFGKGFVQGFGGIVGGILKHPLKIISKTTGLNSTLGAGKQPVVFTTANGTGDLSRYAVYNTSNGNIQFPNKMKSIHISVNIADSGINTAGDIFLEKNGVLVSYALKIADFAKLEYYDINVLQSDVFNLYFNKAGSVTLNSSFVSCITILAEC